MTFYVLLQVLTTYNDLLNHVIIMKNTFTNNENIVLLKLFILNKA